MGDIKILVKKISSRPGALGGYCDGGEYGVINAKKGRINKNIFIVYYLRFVW